MTISGVEFLKIILSHISISQFWKQAQEFSRVVKLESAVQVVMQHDLYPWGAGGGHILTVGMEKEQPYTVTRHSIKKSVLILFSGYSHSLLTYIYVYMYVYTHFFIDGVMQKVTSEKRTLSFNKGNIKLFSPA